MLDLLRTRLTQGHRTTRYPGAPPVLPDRFQGLPALDPSRCSAGSRGSRGSRGSEGSEACEACVLACPTAAIARQPELSLDLGRCLFCRACTEVCPAGAIVFSREHSLAANRREDLVLRAATHHKAEALGVEMRRLFGRSLKLRQVSAGGCNACEADLNVLGTVVFDLGRFGIQFVASPRHADGLVVTGPVTENMKLALERAYEAVPAPKIVIAVGACAISGGPYVDHPEVHGGAASVLPVDLYVPGCPPHPFTILDGLLRLLGRLEKTR